MSWLPKQSVVVPVDFSEPSIAALDTAVQLVGQPSALHVLHVLPKIEMADPGVIWEAINNDSRREHAMQALRERLAGGVYGGAQLAIEFGDPGHEIADYAQRVKADLIVLPSHGRTGLPRLLIGSVAERVVRLAHCPVLVLRK